MDKWKGRGGESQRTEEKSRREKIRKEKESEEKRCRCAIGKSRNTVFFQWFVAPESQKIGSLKPDERWKVVRRCGAKHIWKSKCTKHTILGPLLEVEMSKECTPLWCEAHFKVESAKQLRGKEHLWSFRCHFVWQAQARDCAPCQKRARREGFVAVSTTTTTNYTPLHSTTLQLQLQLQPQLKLELHYITLHYATHIPLQHTTLH